jgi:hypothetical protein
MNVRDIQRDRRASKTSAQGSGRIHTDHALSWPRAFSRRQFARRAAGAAVFGAALGSGWWRSGLAGEKGPLVPVPIPGGTPALGGDFHLFGPTPDGSFDPIDAEPSTITNFNGFLGLAYISGMVTQTNTSTGEVLRLPFVDSDMRFMKGNFRGADGRVQQGAFALV